jgi:hypothetical protein
MRENGNLIAFQKITIQGEEDCCYWPRRVQGKEQKSFFELSRPTHPGISDGPSFKKHFRPALQSVSTSQSPSHCPHGLAAVQTRTLVFRGTDRTGEMDRTGDFECTGELDGDVGTNKSLLTIVSI